MVQGTSTNHIMPHWYSKKRRKESRRAIYMVLRMSGFSTKQCMQIRDWSIFHIVLFLTTRIEEVKKNGKNNY